MYLHGEFQNINGKTVTVHFLKGNRNDEYIIGEDGIMFSSDPVTIQTEIEDTFAPIIKKTCTVKLLANRYIGDLLFADNSRDIKVNVTIDNNFVFGGYVEPLAFTQPFSNEWEEVQITCLDTLSTLQYITPLNNGTSYEDLIKNANKKSFAEFIADMGLRDNINFINGDSSEQIPLYFDGSISLNGGSNILQEIGISESLFLGDEEDDVMTYEEILKEILQYLNLHIIQDGQYYYIFHWDSLKNQNQIYFTDIYGNTSFPYVISNIVVGKEDYGSDDTSFSIGEAFNQIVVTCETTPIETVIENPLEEEDLKPIYNKPSLFMKEWCGNDRSRQDAFLDTWFVCQNIYNQYSRDYSRVWWRDWYLQLYKNNKWTVNNPFYNMSEDELTHNYGQWELLLYGRRMEGRYFPMFVEFGHTNKQKLSDDSGTTELDKTMSLYIPINGNTDESESEAEFLSSQLENRTPLVTYKAGKSIMMSPIDEDTTNYLLFSGKFILVPLMPKTGRNNNDLSEQVYLNTYEDLCKLYNQQGFNAYMYIRQLSFDGNDNSIYIQKYLEDGEYNDINYEEFCCPYISEYEYNGGIDYHYSSDPISNQIDNIKKVPVLECELKVGDKYCVESFDNDGNSVFEWLTLEDCPTYVDNGVTKKQTTFSLGFNPAVGDNIIGKKWPVATNFDFQTGIEAKEGTAIPIKKSDELVGEVEFKIVGVINTSWNQTVRRHPTWFRHTSFSQQERAILPNLAAIQIDNFECKLYTDNAKLDNNGDNDLIYYSSEQQTYINKKDDITFKLNTALTSQEAFELGVKNTVNLSSVVKMSDGTFIDKITKNIMNKTAKAEELFVEDYYNEYSTPKLIVDTTFKNAKFQRTFYRCKFSYLQGKEFYPIGQTFDLLNEKVTTKLKEI